MGVDIDCRLTRLEAEFSSVPINQLFLGSFPGGLVCIQDYKTAASFFSWKPDPLAKAMDAFKHTWTEFTGYANPPWGLIGCCVQYTLQQVATIVLITPF